MLYYRKFLHAIKAFKEYPNLEHELKRNFILSLVKSETLETYYQPIVHLKNKQTLGFEALNRPGTSEAFSNASELFSFAEQHGLIFDLDLKCRELAVTRIHNNLLDRMLFLNVNSNVLMDTSGKDDSFRHLLDSINIKNSNIVLEITEREAIKDFNHFNRVLEEYRNVGFKIAVDDLGAGYSSLQTIAELNPDFIKLDMSLVRDVHQIDYKKLLVETLVGYAEKSKSLLIAEGIEKEEEYKVLNSLGVDFGQGFYIDMPKYPEQIAS